MSSPCAARRVNTAGQAGAEHRDPATGVPRTPGDQPLPHQVSARTGRRRSRAATPCSICPKPAYDASLIEHFAAVCTVLDTTIQTFAPGIRALLGMAPPPVAGGTCTACDGGVAAGRGCGRLRHRSWNDRACSRWIPRRVGPGAGRTRSSMHSRWCSATDRDRHSPGSPRCAAAARRPSIRNSCWTNMDGSATSAVTPKHAPRAPRRWRCADGVPGPEPEHARQAAVSWPSRLIIPAKAGTHVCPRPDPGPVGPRFGGDDDENGSDGARCGYCWEPPRDRRASVIAS